MQRQLADAIAVMQAEADALRGAQLYWVARDMVEVAMGASASLPDAVLGRTCGQRAAVLGQAGGSGAVWPAEDCNHRGRLGRGVRSIARLLLWLDDA